MRLTFKSFITIALLLAGTTSFAQETATAQKCGAAKSRILAKTTVADPAEDNYDVKYVKLNLAMDNLSTTLSGDATTKAVVVSSTSLTSYVFELAMGMVIDSILIDGTIAPYATSGALHTVVLPSALPTGTLFTAQVYYHGTPTSGTLMSSLGMNSLASPSWGNRATYTLSESYHAYEWWPCKQSLRDKIDSSDVWITVPDSLKAGSNGMLQHITTIDPTHVRYEWKERYPIDYYLISVSVANYVDHSFYVHFTGSTDSMLVQNYVYNNPATLPTFVSVIDSTGMMIDYFSQLYGRYPFWHEKYGHCMAPLGGGMEHQTMTTLGFFEGTLIAHELGHQWFGDNVTCGTWADIFMNEGFASYSEDLFTDHFRSHAGMLTDMQARQTNVKSSPGGTIYVDDTTSETRIFDSRLSYDKGACLLHMLRFVINNDSTFFQAYKNYQVQMTDSTGIISDFKTVVQNTAGTTVNQMNIDTFFNQWAYLQGYPIYTVKWNEFGNDVYIKLDQTTSVPSSDPLFYTPIELSLHSASGDTVVRVFNNQASQLYHFTWGKTMTGMTFDPNYWLLYQLASLSQDPTLSVADLTTSSTYISPNPTNNYWQVEGLSADSKLTLTDMTGRVLWTAPAKGSSMQILAEQLVPGMYILQISGGANTTSFKLVKK